MAQPPDPSEFADAAEGAAEEAADAAVEGESAGIMDGLLSTTPEDSPANFDVPNYQAHAIIGGKKFLNGIAPSMDIGSGTPAVANFLQSGLGVLSSRDGDSEASDDVGNGSYGTPGRET